MLFCENTSYVILGVTKIHFLFPKLGIVTSIKIFRNLHEDLLKVYSLADRWKKSSLSSYINSGRHSYWLLYTLFSNGEAGAAIT